MVEKRFNQLGMPDIECFENYLPTAFSSELTLLQKVNKIIQDLIRNFDLTNEMVDYLNNFIETFDENLYETVDDILNEWLKNDKLSKFIRDLINEEVIEARTDYLGKKYVNLKERLDSEKADIVEVTNQLTHKANKDEVTNIMTPKGNKLYNSLPTTGNTIGDYYYSPDGDGVNGAGNYVWNGTAWYFGGTGDEGYNKLKEELSNSVNLIDLTSSLTIKGYLDASGVFREHNTLFTSDYIYIQNTNIAFKAYGIKSEQVNFSVGNVCFYNEEKIFISAISYSEINPGIIYSSNNRIPSCAKYMRLCSNKNDGYFICYDKLSIPSQLVLDLTDKLFKNWGYINPSGTVVPTAENKWSYTDAIDVHLYNQIEYSLYCGSGSLIIAKYNKNMELIGSLPATETGYYLYQGVYDISDAYYVKMVCYYKNINIYAKAYAVDSGENQKSDIKYQHCIDKPFNFNGKKALFYGDSITAGFTSGSSVTQNNYPKLFSQSVGMSYTNYGIGGSCFSKIYNNVETIINTIKTTDLSTLTNADYIFIAGGVNDWGTGASKEELVNALSTLRDFINNNNLQEKVILITPINEGGKSTPETPKMTLQDTRNIITHFGLENGYSVIQGYLFPFPNSDDDIDYINKMFGDKLHPSELGYRVYAKSLKTVLC